MLPRVVVVAATVAVLTSAPAPGGGAPAAPVAPVQAATSWTPEVLAQVSIATADGVAVGTDGTTYATEASRDRVLSQQGDGAVRVLPLEVDGPTAIDAADDGRLAIVTKTVLVVARPDGSQADTPLPDGASVDAVAFDSAGTAYVTDWDRSDVYRLGTDGTWARVDFGAIGRFRGLAVGPDDSLYVIDLDALDVVRREPDGTVTAVGFTGLDDPIALDVEGDRIAVAQSGNVVVREGDGTEGSPTDFGAGDPRGIRLLADGTLLLAYHASDGGRSPAPAGGVLRLPDGGTVERMRFGDLYAFGSVAAAEARRVLYTSWNGVPGYSDANPLRRVTGAGSSEDVAPGSAQGMEIAAADDGTVYRTTGNLSVERTAPDGTTSAIVLTGEPGVDTISGLSVDEFGRLFVALGSGYGTGEFAVVEPLADGGSKAWYRSDGSTGLQAMAAGGGTVSIVTYAEPGGPQLLVSIAADGTTTERRTLGEPPVSTMEVDAGGTAYLVSYPVRSAVITVVAPDGSATDAAYAEAMYPRSLAIGPDRTLYIGDDQYGLLAIAGVGTEAVAPVAPGAAAPATPIPGDPSFTG